MAGLILARSRGARTAPPMTTTQADDMAQGNAPIPLAERTTRPNPVRSWVRLLRPRQWVKNFFVLAALLFSGRGTQIDYAVDAVAAFAVFCLLASAVYVLNDLVDRESDRAHPTKRSRPIASGEVSAPVALTAAALLAATGLAMAFSMTVGLGAIAATYLLLNAAYSLVLKRVVIVDVFTIASFFVLRLVAGAVAVDVRPSVWLILCGGLLALYLGFAKRRQELLLLGQSSGDHRAVLVNYSTPFLDQLSSVILGVTVVCYIMYSRESDTARAIGGDALTYSTVFVLYGVIRYLYLVHARADGNPTDTLLTDRGLLAAVGAWSVYCAWIIYRPWAG
jgi:4-hydroxybenzoate polyprenyltransferase